MDRRGDLLLSDEDRLPWLEPAAPMSERNPRAALRWAVIAGGGLLLLAVLIVGGLWLTRTGDVTEGNGALIEAPKEPYKVAVTEPGGMEVEGQGDTSFPTSVGETSNGSIDLDAQPEAPVATAPAPEPAPAPVAKAAPPARSVTASVPESGGRLAAAPAGARTPRVVTSGEGGGSLVQLGSFNSEARAREAWRILSGRIQALGEREPLIATGEVDGRQVYRLRLDGGSAAGARELCQRVRIGGEACLVVGR